MTNNFIEEEYDVYIEDRNNVYTEEEMAEE